MQLWKNRIFVESVPVNSDEPWILTETLEQCAQKCLEQYACKMMSYTVSSTTNIDDHNYPTKCWLLADSAQSKPNIIVSDYEMYFGVRCEMVHPQIPDANTPPDKIIQGYGIGFPVEHLCEGSILETGEDVEVQTINTLPPEWRLTFEFSLEDLPPGGVDTTDWDSLLVLSTTASEDNRIPGIFLKSDRFGFRHTKNVGPNIAWDLIREMPAPGVLTKMIIETTVNENGTTTMSVKIGGAPPQMKDIGVLEQAHSVTIYAGSVNPGRRATQGVLCSLKFENKEDTCTEAGKMLFWEGFFAGSGGNWGDGYTSDSLENCAQQCVNIDECKGFNFNAANKYCRIKESIIEIFSAESTTIFDSMGLKCDIANLQKPNIPETKIIQAEIHQAVECEGSLTTKMYADIGTHQGNLDFVGPRGDTGEVGPVDDEYDCAHKCIEFDGHGDSKNRLCQAWTYVPSGGYCYLKHRAEHSWVFSSTGSPAGKITGIRCNHIQHNHINKDVKEIYKAHPCDILNGNCGQTCVREGVKARCECAYGYDNQPPPTANKCMPYCSEYYSWCPTNSICSGKAETILEFSLADMDQSPVLDSFVVHFKLGETIVQSHRFSALYFDKIIDKTIFFGRIGEDDQDNRNTNGKWDRVEIHANGNKAVAFSKFMIKSDEIVIDFLDTEKCQYLWLGKGANGQDENEECYKLLAMKSGIATKPLGSQCRALAGHVCTGEECVGNNYCLDNTCMFKKGFCPSALSFDPKTALENMPDFFFRLQVPCNNGGCTMSGNVQASIVLKNVCALEFGHYSNMRSVFVGQGGCTSSVEIEWQCGNRDEITHAVEIKNGGYRLFGVINCCIAGGSICSKTYKTSGNYKEDYHDRFSTYAENGPIMTGDQWASVDSVRFSVPDGDSWLYIALSKTNPITTLQNSVEILFGGFDGYRSLIRTKIDKYNTRILKQVNHGNRNQFRSRILNFQLKIDKNQVALLDNLGNTIISADVSDTYEYLYISNNGGGGQTGQAKSKGMITWHINFCPDTPLIVHPCDTSDNRAIRPKITRYEDWNQNFVGGEYDQDGKRLPVCEHNCHKTGSRPDDFYCSCNAPLILDETGKLCQSEPIIQKEIVIDQIPTVRRQWRLNFELKPAKLVNSQSGVLRMIYKRKETDENVGNYDNLAVEILADGSFDVLFNFDKTGQISVFEHVRPTLLINEWSKVVISQIQSTPPTNGEGAIRFYLIVEINEVEYVNLIATDQMDSSFMPQLYDVKILTGVPGENAKIQLQNYNFEHFENNWSVGVQHTECWESCRLKGWQDNYVFDGGCSFCQNGFCCRGDGQGNTCSNSVMNAINNAGLGPYSSKHYCYYPPVHPCDRRDPNGPCKDSQCIKDGDSARCECYPNTTMENGTCVLDSIGHKFEVVILSKKATATQAQLKLALPNAMFVSSIPYDLTRHVTAQLDVTIRPNENLDETILRFTLYDKTNDLYELYYDELHTVIEKIAEVGTFGIDAQENPNYKFLHRCDLSIDEGKPQGSLNGCENIPGTYCVPLDNIHRYRCVCKDGYTPINQEETHNIECRKIHPCEINNGGCEHQCIQQDETAQCQCDQGYKPITENPKLCRKTHTCEISNGGCEQKCNQIGENSSCSCLAGFTLSPDLTSCIQLHQCDIDNGGCEQRCIPDGAEFICDCNVGFIPMEPPNEKFCSKVPPCESSSNAKCGDNAVCHNTGADTMECVCDDGFELNEDKTTCSKLHPCALGNGGCEQKCERDGDAARCDCHAGFDVRDPPNEKSCMKYCTEADWCPDGSSCTKEIGTILEYNLKNAQTSHFVKSLVINFELDGKKVLSRRFSELYFEKISDNKLNLGYTGAWNYVEIEVQETVAIAFSNLQIKSDNTVVDFVNRNDCEYLWLGKSDNEPVQMCYTQLAHRVLTMPTAAEGSQCIANVGYRCTGQNCVGQRCADNTCVFQRDSCESDLSLDPVTALETMPDFYVRLPFGHKTEASMWIHGTVQGFMKFEEDGQELDNVYFRHYSNLQTVFGNGSKDGACTRSITIEWKCGDRDEIIYGVDFGNCDYRLYGTMSCCTAGGSICSKTYKTSEKYISQWNILVQSAAGRLDEISSFLTEKNE